MGRSLSWQNAGRARSGRLSRREFIQAAGASAKRTRVFLQEVNSPRFRILRDPANLLEADELEEMFDKLTPWVDCLHAKDRKLHVDQVAPAGRGDLEDRKFVSLARQRTPRAPLILEYVGPENDEQALHHLQQALRAAGPQ